MSVPLHADPRLLRKLRTILRRANFTLSALSNLLDGDLTELKSTSPRLIYATQRPTRLNTLIRLFIAGVPVPTKQAEAAFDPLPLAGLAASGILRLESRTARALNNAMSSGGRTMSGGIDARAMEIPRKIFAAARNTEEAG